MRSAVSPAVVEGYFIHIRKVEMVEDREEDQAEEQHGRGRKRPRRRRKVGRFRKVTIIGHASHSYIFEDLEPGTQYEIKVRARGAL